MALERFSSSTTFRNSPSFSKTLMHVENRKVSCKLESGNKLTAGPTMRIFGAHKHSFSCPTDRDRALLQREIRSYAGHQQTSSRRLPENKSLSANCDISSTVHPQKAHNGVVYRNTAHSISKRARVHSSRNLPVGQQTRWTVQDRTT